MKFFPITLLVLCMANLCFAAPTYNCDDGAGSQLKIQIDNAQTLKLLHFYKGSNRDIVLSPKQNSNTPDGYTNFVGESGCLPSAGSTKPSCGAIAYFEILVSQSLMNSETEGTIVYINNTYQCSSVTDTIEL